MRRLAFLAALAFGCDDPEVASRAANILEHGIVQARIECADVPANSSAWPTTFTVYKLQDGSTIGSGFGTHLGTVPTSFCSRDEECAQVYAVGSGRGQSPFPLACPSAMVESFSINAGTIEFCLDNVGVYETFDPELYCTGFNLEAFGVE